MVKETQIGQLVIDLKIKTEALERGAEAVKNKLQEIEKQNEQLKSSNSGLDASFIAMSAGIVGSLIKIKSAVSEGIDKYKEYESASKGLESIVKGQGLSFYDAQDFIEEYISDGLIPLSDATLAYKNLAARGYNEKQIKQTMIALKDAAAFGRQSTYEYGEAIATATEGLKNENSILVDNAGVTKNVAKMWEEYAKSIGKTRDSLTQEEKIEAEVNGIREESKNQIGDAAKYAETYAGQQAQLNASSIELNKTFGETMIPILTQINSILLPIIQNVSEFIKNNGEATTGITVFTATLLSTIAVLTAIKKAYIAYTTAAKAADMTTKAFTISLLKNPITLAAVGIATVLGLLTAYKTAVDEQSEAQDRLNEITERYNKIQEGTYEYTDENIAKEQAAKKSIEEQIELLNKILELEQKIKEEGGENSKGTGGLESQKASLSRIQDPELRKSLEESLDSSIGKVNEYNAALNQAKKALEDSRKANGNYGNSIDELNKKLEASSSFLDEANVVKNISKAIDIESIKTMQKEAAQKQANVNKMQAYLDVIKTGKKETTEYKTAEKELAKAYGDASTAAGINVDTAQAWIDAEKIKADEAWKGSQDTISAYIAIINTALGSEQIQRQVAQNVGMSWEEIVPRLQTILGLLQTMAGYKATEVPNITPTTVSTPKSSGGSSSYSNKKLDNYKKEIEHKKAMDQLSLNQEISMYEYALRVYAKTADERMELREKIYSLNKELAQKEKEILDQQTEDYEAYIQQQINSRGAEYNINDRNRDYNKIIQMHRNYLNQIMQDERLSLDERKQIYREELQTIRDYEQQKRDLRVEQIDNTVSQLTNAITKQLEEMQEKDKQLLDENLKVVEEWKNARIKAINDEYDAKIEAINKELEALNKAEQQKTRAEEDAEYEKKKKRLEDLVAFEHDAVTKANYQKELDKLVAEYQKKLDKRALEDKKEALNEQKELLQEEQDNKVQAVEDEAKRKTEIYENQLTELEKYYDEQIEMAQKTAENMLLNVSQNQNQILELLKNYGDAYEITGQTLGEKLAQGINEGIASKIENIIAKLQNTIDANIEAQIARMTSSAYKYEAGANKPQTKTVTVTQINHIEQNPEMPSETYRKLHNVSEDLAAQLRTELD